MGMPKKFVGDEGCESVEATRDDAACTHAAFSEYDRNTGITKQHR